jgi:hypothetical protein
MNRAPPLDIPNIACIEKAVGKQELFSNKINYMHPPSLKNDYPKILEI